MNNKKKRFAYATCIDCGKDFEKKDENVIRCDDCNGDLEEIYL